MRELLKPFTQHFYNIINPLTDSTNQLGALGLHPAGVLALPLDTNESP